MKISLAIPTNRGVQPRTFQCLLELVAEARKKYDLHILVPEEGYTIAENRTYMTVQALNNKSDYILMIDDDMTFPPDLLDRLLANNKDICGTAYHSRGNTNTMPKYLDTGINAIAEVAPKEYIDLETNTDPKYKDTFECFATGTGIMLVKCEVFRKVKRPWFAFEFHETGQVKLGEDWYFPVDPDTPILNDDFVWRPIKDYKIGETVLGIDEYAINTNGYRYFKKAIVEQIVKKQLDVWRIITEKGEVLTTADHQWLIKRNWRSKKNRKLDYPKAGKWDWCKTEKIKEGDYISTPVKNKKNPDIENRDYVAGYFMGIWDGDGTLDKEKYLKVEQVDSSAIERLKDYCEKAYIKYSLSWRILKNPKWKPLNGIRIWLKDLNPLLESSIENKDYVQGYLAGIFDAEGCNCYDLDIGNNNQELLDKIRNYLNTLGIGNVKQNDRIVIGKITDMIDFFIQCQPAIKRKVCIKNRTLKHNNNKVLKIEKTNQIKEMICLGTSTKTFIAEGLSSHNCREAKKVGYKIFTDPRPKVGHLGEVIYQ